MMYLYPWIEHPEAPICEPSKTIAAAVEGYGTYFVAVDGTVLVIPVLQVALERGEFSPFADLEPTGWGTGLRTTARGEALLIRLLVNFAHGVELLFELPVPDGTEAHQVQDAALDLIGGCPFLIITTRDAWPDIEGHRYVHPDWLVIPFRSSLGDEIENAREALQLLQVARMDGV
jgi:hypothetical protein